MNRAILPDDNFFSVIKELIVEYFSRECIKCHIRQGAVTNFQFKWL